MNPDYAVGVHKMLKVAQSVGIHFATFNEHPEQAVDAHEKDVKIALKKYNVPVSEFWILEFGEERELKKPLET
jgi:L-ascorbate metabolism protein UlaG (beta-lactamase superfamily)